MLENNSTGYKEIMIINGIYNKEGFKKENRKHSSKLVSLLKINLLQKFKKMMCSNFFTKALILIVEILT